MVVAPELTGPTGYLEWTTQASLRRYVACCWTGSIDACGSPSAEPVLPDGCMDIIWDGRRLFVAGPDTGPAPAGEEGLFYVGMRFRPGMAPLFLGPLDPSVVEAHLDALEAAQAEDGGWPITWESLSSAAEAECRGVETLRALRVLRAFGRIG